MDKITECQNVQYISKKLIKKIGIKSGAKMKCGLCQFKIPKQAKLCGHCQARIEPYFEFDGILERILGFGLIGFLLTGVMTNFTKNNILIAIPLIVGVLTGVKRSFRARAIKDDLNEKCSGSYL